LLTYSEADLTYYF